MLKRLLELLGDSATYGLGSISGPLVGFLLLPLYTRLLTPADYGVLAMLAVMELVFAGVAGLGMTSAIFWRTSQAKTEGERHAVFSTGLCSVVASVSLLACGGIAAASTIASVLVGDAGAAGLVRLALVSAAVLLVADVPLGMMRADRRVRAIAAVNLGRTLLGIAVTIPLVAGAQWGVRGVVFGALVADIAFAATVLGLVGRRLRLRPDMATWRRMASYGLPIVPHRLQSIGLVVFGQTVVRALLGLEQAGLFAIACRFAAPVELALGAFSRAWVPFRFHVHAKDPAPAAFFRSAAIYVLAALAWLWLGVSLWGAEVARLMTHDSFHSAARLIPLVALIPVTQGLYFLLGVGVELSDDTRPIPLISLVGLVTVMLATFVLVEPFGAAGAAAATALGWVAMAAMAYRLARTRFSVHYDWLPLGTIGLLASAGVVAGALAAGLPVGPRVALGAVFSVAFPLAVLAVLHRSPNESERMRILLGRLGWPARSAR